MNALFSKSDFAFIRSDEDWSRLQDLSARLAAPLRRIVDAELKQGNLIVDMGEDYPDQGSINITLRKRFDGRYESEDVVFAICDDPHYWHADYSTKSFPTHLLIC